MADLSLRRTTTCLGCDAPMPNAALDAVLCLSCLDTMDELELGSPIEGPAAPRGPGPDDEDEGDLS
jgi:hypothetical protein